MKNVKINKFYFNQIGGAEFIFEEDIKPKTLIPVLNKYKDIAYSFDNRTLSVFLIKDIETLEKIMWDLTSPEPEVKTDIVIESREETGFISVKLYNDKKKLKKIYFDYISDHMALPPTIIENKLYTRICGNIDEMFDLSRVVADLPKPNVPDSGKIKDVSVELLPGNFIIRIEDSIGWVEVEDLKKYGTIYEENNAGFRIIKIVVNSLYNPEILANYLKHKYE